MNLDLKNSTNSKLIRLFTLTTEHVGPEYVAWLNDPMVNQYLECRFAVHSVKSTREVVSSLMASETDLLMGIFSLELNKHIGNIKLGWIDRHHSTAEVGLLIGDKNAWGKGIATEAIQLTIEVAKQLELRKLTAGYYESNIGSKRVFEKSGFVVEGKRKAQFLLDEKSENHVVIGLLL